MSALVSAGQLAAELADPSLVVLDATVELPKPRHDGDHRAVPGLAGFRAGHIPGARHADLLGALARPGAGFHFAQPQPAALAQALGALGVGAGSHVVAYDRGAMIWAARLWVALDQIGVPVRVLDGGLPAWRAAGGAVEQGDPPPAAAVAPLVPVPKPRFADRAAVEAIVADPARGQLVCTLGDDVFSGAAPTRYARRGHIPTSICVPARGLLGDDGRLRPAGELRDVLAPVLGDPRPTTLYCGGAISASLAALALHELGEPGVAVYDGSIDEWARHPDLPMETGA